MSEPANDQTSFELLHKEDGVWLEHSEWGLVNLGAFEPVADKLATFLEREDFGELATR